MFQKANNMQKYYDVLCDDNIWRLGIVENNIQKELIIEIRFDGWSKLKNQVNKN